MKKLWALRHVLGLLIAFGLGAALLVVAVMIYPMYVGVAVLLVIGWVVASQPRVRRERERTRKLVDEAFAAAYSQLPHSPSLAMFSSYGYPAFKVEFRSKSEMECAAIENGAFKRDIGRIFEGYGSRSRPFNTDMAIHFTYEGHLDELRVRYKHAYKA